MKKILLVATGAFLMVENAMCSDSLQNIQPGENVKIKQIKDIKPIDKPFPVDKPMFGSDTVVTVDTDSASNEQHQLRICSDSLETVKYIMESLVVKKVDLGTQTTSELEEDFGHIMNLLEISNNSTPYDFMKAMLDNSKVQENNDSALQEWGSSIDLFIKMQGRKMLRNK